jgi:hypothetical protein
MGGLSRRAFFAISAGAAVACHSEWTRASLPQSHPLSIDQSTEAANLLNLQAFLQCPERLGLVGLVSMSARERASDRDFGDRLLLFPFTRDRSASDLCAYLPGPSAIAPARATTPMAPGGLPADEYLCHFVLNAPPQDFISFSVGQPFANGAEKRPWHSNVDLGGQRAIGIGWTSHNLNHPWFDGSRWIPNDGDGGIWRARIVAGLRGLAADQSTASLSGWNGPAGARSA